MDEDSVATLDLFCASLEKEIKFHKLSDNAIKRVIKYRDEAVFYTEYARLVIYAVLGPKNAECIWGSKAYPDGGYHTLDELYWIATIINPEIAWEIKKKRKTEELSVQTFDFSNIKKRLPNIEKFLRANVVGQDEAIDKTLDVLYKTAAGIANPNKPLAVLLFTGPSGSGKTLLAKALATAIFCENPTPTKLTSPPSFLRIDCTLYQQKHEISNLIGCFAPDTHIIYSGGTKDISDIEVGDFVLSKDGSYREVKNTYQYEHSGDMISIDIANKCKPIVCTPGHEILAIRPDNIKRSGLKKSFGIEPQWINAENLMKDDLVLFPRVKTNKIPTVIDMWEYSKNLPNFKCDDVSVWGQESHKTNRYITIDDKFMRLAGFYISEGGSSKSNKSFNFTFSSLETKYIDEVQELVSSIFGNVGCKVEYRGSSTRVFFFSKPITILLKTMFGRNAWEKVIPQDVIEYDDSLLWPLVETMICGDGSTSVLRRIQYDTVSKELAASFQVVLAKLGIISSLQNPGTFISGKNSKWAKYNYCTRYRIYISGKQIDNLSLTMPGLDIKTGSNLLSYQRKSGINEDYIMSRINSVDRVKYSGTVYDLEVDETSSYVAGYAVVHNSPQGYIGSDLGSPLPEFLMQNTTGNIVLIDEVEKANPSLYQIFMGLFDYGCIKDNKQKEATAYNTIFIMTSNAGSSEASMELARLDCPVGFVSYSDDKEKVSKDAYMKKISDTFTPEFRGRINEMVIFNHLNDESYSKILELELAHISRLLGRKKINLKVTPSAKQAILKGAISDEFGARILSKYIDDEILRRLSRLIVTTDETKFVCRHIDGNFVVEPR